MSIRERIKAISLQMATSNPPLSVLSDFEIALAGLLSAVNDEVTHAEIAFRQAILQADATSAAAKKQIAEGGPTYARLLEAKAAYDSCYQMLLTCRNQIRRATDEMRLSK